MRFLVLLESYVPPPPKSLCPLASNALIGFVGNKNPGTLESRGLPLASNALIGFVGNAAQNNSEFAVYTDSLPMR